MRGYEALHVVYPLSTWMVRELLASTKDTTLRRVCDLAATPCRSVGRLTLPKKRQAHNRCVAVTTDVLYCLFVTSGELKRWLASKGCKFSPGRGGHLTVRLGDKVSEVSHEHARDRRRSEPPRKGDDNMRYAVRLAKDDNGTFMATVPDVPEAITYGDTKAEALERVVDAILTVFDERIRQRRAIPAATTAGSVSVEIPILEAAKVSLYQTMAEKKVSKAELGRRMNVHLPQVDRILNVRHGSQIDQIVSAFYVLGKRVDFVISDDPKPVKTLPGFMASVGKKPARATSRRAGLAAKKR